MMHPTFEVAEDLDWFPDEYDDIDAADPADVLWDAVSDIESEDMDATDLADVLWDALSDDYADADPDDVADALAEMLETMSPAEAFNFAKAFKQIGRSAGKVVANPVFGQIAGTVLPIAGGAVGTVFGGPVGTALGSSLGSAAAGALSKGARSRPGLPAVGRAIPAVAGGSAAAAQGLVLTQQPEVLKSLLALSMGSQGQKSVNGVPVAKVLSMLSSVFGQAAADADELMYLDQEGVDQADDSGDFAGDTETAQDPSRTLYTRLLDADNDEFAHAAGLL